MGFLGAVVQQGMGVVDVAMKQGERDAATQTNLAELKKGWESEDAAAADARARGSHEAALAIRRASQTTGAARVAFAANNVLGTSGTAAKVQEATVAAGLEDADAIRANALAEAMGHKQTAQRYRTEATRQVVARDNAFSSSIIGWAGGAVEGAANFMGKGGGGL